VSSRSQIEILIKALFADADEDVQVLVVKQ
jgi:hypothetical protein